ncbi:ErmE/ErmH/ErmO/ErmR family 23S rRNA (adenine(2058)-N(6))-methyltransferase [Streptomyces iconiensis]|uniref:ErmE/ErmH/ErmO/ErmR family 23S rRNA (Adenine(2058)-N(6))-methyltransferase n=1 Tax=Streptomyces iconiensis TaxID=1384038 RepID=A0ABT6ZW91_9ACTN|nr:ErmE/ErmH/ErmO/ErmR family 23S rRNA (adenine(2058)-N(6))-methyltransferase [Streptomyces iconiensis]MDJ1133340.1 ErmE/ErmH/ErmO/ErmR family 23S rRNA (adenine(2058)-N(6))-methyltransferase [Streptomyces iconiensis]
MARRRKTLSQNFLNSPYAVGLVVRLAAPGAGELVVEPGAGEGVLTRALARRCDRLVAHEVDPALMARLSARTRGLAHVRAVQGDFLRSLPPREPFAVVGNIPFSRTSDIVRWCLEAPSLTSATLVTQHEYARKRTGGHGRWSLLTVRTWPEYEWRLLARVTRHHFTPVPRTDAAVLRVERRTVPLLAREALPYYGEFTAHGFTGVGGSLFATLCRRHPTRRVRAAFRDLGLAEPAPVGHVNPQQWLSLFDALYGNGPARAPVTTGVSSRAGSAPRLPGSPRSRASRRG